MKHSFPEGDLNTEHTEGSKYTEVTLVIIEFDGNRWIQDAWVKVSFDRGSDQTRTSKNSSVLPGTRFAAGDKVSLDLESQFWLLK